MSAKTSILITDSDLDGVGSVVLSKAFDIHYDNVIITNPRQVNSAEIVEIAKKYDKIVVTDLSFSETTLHFLLTLKKDVTVLDHHKTSAYLNNSDMYPHCISDSSRCGTRLYFEEVVSRIPYVQINAASRKFVALVDTYDRWQQDSDLWQEAYKLNSIFAYFMKNPQPFIEKYANKLKNGSFTYDEDDENALLATQALIDKAYEFADSHLKIKRQSKSYHGITYHKGFCSEVGNALLKNHNLTYVIMIENVKREQASARSIPSFDCTTLVGFYSHKNAAGGKFDKGYLDRVYNRFDELI